MQDTVSFEDSKAPLASWVQDRVEMWETHRDQNYKAKW